MSVQFRPKTSQRGAYYYPEIAQAPGPAGLGVTGDNSYATLYGQDWTLVLNEDDDMLYLYREDGDGSWTRITSDLPSVFSTPLPADARRIALAFDQSARVIVLYEDGTGVHVTRWDPGAETYLQNVDFAGVDPCLFMDATIADPAGWPTTADGWSVTEAAAWGLTVRFEWLPEPVYVEDNAIGYSDVLLFYLSTDRLTLYARVQSGIYATPIQLATFSEPVILDQVLVSDNGYQALLSDANGDALADVLQSDPYLGDFEIVAQVDETVLAAQQPQDYALRLTTITHEGEAEAATAGQDSADWELRATAGAVQAEPEAVTGGQDTATWEQVAQAIAHEGEPEAVTGTQDTSLWEMVQQIVTHDGEPEAVNASQATSAWRLTEV